MNTHTDYSFAESHPNICKTSYLWSWFEVPILYTWLIMLSKFVCILTIYICMFSLKRCLALIFVYFKLTWVSVYN